MCITPLLPVARGAGARVMWFNSQWKLSAYPAHFCMETNIPGCREVISHEIDGLLVPAKDAQALAEAIMRLLDDPVLVRRLGLAALKKATLQLDERIINAQTMTIYDNL